MHGGYSKDGLAIRANTFLIIDRVLYRIPGLLGFEGGIQRGHGLIYYLLVFNDVGQLRRRLLGCDD